MKIWYLGDSLLSAAIQEVANQLELELTDSSQPDSFLEQVWTEQIHEGEFRSRTKPDCFAVLFLNNSDYDSEVLIQILLQKLTPESKIVLMVHPVEAKAAEGMTAHWEGDRYKLVRLESLSFGYVTQELVAVLS